MTGRVFIGITTRSPTAMELRNAHSCPVVLAHLWGRGRVQAVDDPRTSSGRRG